MMTKVTRCQHAPGTVYTRNSDVADDEWALVILDLVLMDEDALQR